MQVILGAGGPVGVELARALTTYTGDIRLVSRNPEKVNPTDHLMSADLTDAEAVMKAVEGCEVAYLTVGVPYSTRMWQQIWPMIMQNVIKVCRHHGAKLVFFDNIYMYPPHKLDPITEQLPNAPETKKGRVRGQIVRTLWDEVERGGLQAVVARSADFYGPGIKGTSILTEIVFNPLSEGKTATWLGSDKFKHSFTYTPDAGKATALLGNSPSAINQVWHLPTASNPMTGKEWIEAIASAMGSKPKYRVANKFMMSLMGLFVPAMKETVEMLYQYTQDYVFDSKKFEEAFDLDPTPYDVGIAQIIKQDYS